MLALPIGTGILEKYLSPRNTHSQFPSSLVEPNASISHNARQLGEVADWAHRYLNFRKRSGARRQFGFHSYRYFAKMLVMCSFPDRCCTIA